MLKARKRKKKIKMDLCVCLEFLPGEPEKIVEFFVGEKKTAREVLELALTKEQLESGYYLIEDNEGKTLEELSYDKDIVWVRLDRTRKKPNSNDDGACATTQLDYEDGYTKDAAKEEPKEDDILIEFEEKAKTPTTRRSEQNGSILQHSSIEPIAEEERRNSHSVDDTDDEKSNDEIRESTTSTPAQDLRRDEDPCSQRGHLFGIIATITGGGLTLARNDAIFVILFLIGLCFFTATLFNNKTFFYLKNARRSEEGVSGYIQDLRKVRPLLKWTVSSYHMATENTSKKHKRRIKQITHEATKFWIPKVFANGGDDLNKIIEMERSTKKSELVQLKLTKSFKFLDTKSKTLYLDTLRRFRAHHNRDNKLAFKCELLIDGFEPLTLFHPLRATTPKRCIGLWSYFLASFCCLGIPYRFWFNRKARKIRFNMIKYIGEITDEEFTYVLSDDDDNSMELDRSSSLLIPDYGQSLYDSHTSAELGSPVQSKGKKSKKHFKTVKEGEIAKNYETAEDIPIQCEVPMGVYGELRQRTRNRSSSVEIFLHHQKSLGKSKGQSFSIYNQALNGAAIDFH